MRRFSFLATATLAVIVPSSASLAVSFADRVVSYSPGAGAGVYTNPAVALGAPHGLTGENAAALPYFGDAAVLSPFSGAYQDDEIVRIGEGGSITLRLERYVNVGAGAEFGVIENVSLFDPNYPSGTTSSPAATFGEDNALVEVSKDGITFVGLTGGSATNVLFNLPAIYYLNAGAFDTSVPGVPQVADFGKPFEPIGGLSAFDGKASFSEVVSVFNGSAGGTWLDVSASGLDQIGYVRLTVPDDGNVATSTTLELDSILTNTALLGGLVPEPATLAACAIILPIVRRRR